MGYKWVRNVAENWESMMEVKRDVEAEIGGLKARNEELETEVKVLRGRVRALEARNEALVRRANDAWRQIRAILGYALRPVEA
jgi:FtsZ-binding cell division protein ZapB